KRRHRQHRAQDTTGQNGLEHDNLLVVRTRRDRVCVLWFPLLMMTRTFSHMRHRHCPLVKRRFAWIDTETALKMAADLVTPEIRLSIFCEIRMMKFSFGRPDM